MVINLEERKIDINLLQNHFDLKFILNYSIYIKAPSG